MTTLTLKLSTKRADDTEIYEEISLDQGLYSDVMLAMLYAKLKAAFDASLATP